MIYEWLHLAQFAPSPGEQQPARVPILGPVALTRDIEAPSDHNLTAYLRLGRSRGEHDDPSLARYD
jgi:hypothetical protein